MNHFGNCCFKLWKEEMMRVEENQSSNNAIPRVKEVTNRDYK